MAVELVEEGGGPRYYLDGRPLHAGDVIEVKRRNEWETARYEYSWSRGEDLRAFLVFGEETLPFDPADAEFYRWRR